MAQGGDTRYGQPRANKQGNQSTAGLQRAFYRWVEAQATEQELKEYMRDTKNPAVRRKFIQVFLNAESVRDFCEVTNQTHGAPKQTIEMTQLPDVRIVLDDTAAEDVEAVTDEE